MNSWQFVIDAAHQDVVKTILRSREKQVLAIVSLLKSEGPMTASKIAERTGYSRRGVETTLYLTRKHLGAVKLLRINKGVKNIDSISEFISVKKWDSELKAGTSIGNRYFFFNYMNYVRENSSFKSPDELLQDALDCNARGLNNHVAMAKAFIMGDLGHIAPATKGKYYNIIRGFYAHNGVLLPRSQLPKDPIVEVEVTKRELRAEPMLVMARKVVTSDITARDRSVIMTILQSAMDESTFAKSFNFVGYSQICDHFGTTDWKKWDVENVPVRFDLVRPKTGRKFYTFIDRDAVIALKDWLNVRFSLTSSEIKIHDARRSDRVPLSDPIFISKTGKGISPAYVSVSFRRWGMKAGVNVKSMEKVGRYHGSMIRYPFHCHEFRDTMLSIASTLGLRPVAEFFLAHNIDHLGYDKSPYSHPEHYVESYKILAKYLNVLSSEPEKLALIRKTEALQIKNDDLENKRFVQMKKMEEELDNQRKVNRLIMEMNTTPRDSQRYGEIIAALNTMRLEGRF